MTENAHIQRSPLFIGVPYMKKISDGKVILIRFHTNFFVTYTHTYRQRSLLFIEIDYRVNSVLVTCFGSDSCAAFGLTATLFTISYFHSYGQSGCEAESRAACHEHFHSLHSCCECHKRSSLYNRLQEKVVNVVCVYVVCHKRFGQKIL